MKQKNSFVLVTTALQIYLLTKTKYNQKVQKTYFKHFLCTDFFLCLQFTKLQLLFYYVSMMAFVFSFIFKYPTSRQR